MCRVRLIVGIVASAGVELAPIIIPDWQPAVRIVISDLIGEGIGTLQGWWTVLRRERRAAQAARLTELTAVRPTATRRVE